MPKIHPGDIPPDMQNLIMAKAMEAFLAAIGRDETNALAKKRASAAAEAGIQAWLALNGKAEGA